jgi:hypothetical protein
MSNKDADLSGYSLGRKPCEWESAITALERYFYRKHGEWQSIAGVVAFVVFVALPIALVVIHPDQDLNGGFQVLGYFLLSTAIAVLLYVVMMHIGFSIRAQAKDFLEAQSNRSELESSRDTIRRLEGDMARQEEQIGKILARLDEAEKQRLTLRVQMDAVLKSWWMRSTAAGLKSGSPQSEWEGE